MMRYLNELESFENLTLDEYLDNFRVQLVVERILELIIQASLDVARFLLKNIHQVTVVENAAVFLEAGQYGLIAMEVATELAEFGKFRNVLAHMYEEIDPVVVFGAIRETLDIYPIYARQITEYVDSLNLQINDDEPSR
ncbi:MULTISPECIES: type VII toxin-antitoxin system HepT family RNase toxin [Leptolyngbya]|uniref:type VII toxin-antitoxin system HepT family RNase toxin n=1 Tax=Leptolyngbya TaxID=47251 RepID=UPI0016851D8A|nr:DUF86 domain-containing protein [Leptolyngbya sp. FACHB-1624]MBD1856179.1 DUF86 domain-containing protein [Leptolyngbya sp. FACHB-1624]